MTTIINKRKTIKRTSLTVNPARFIELKDYAAQVTAKTNEPISWTEFANYVLDNYAADAKEDLIHALNNEKN